MTSSTELSKGGDGASGKAAPGGSGSCAPGDAPDLSTGAPPDPSPGLSPGLAALLAFATGAVAANIYYNQPILGLMEHEFDAGASIAFVNTFTQLGYTAGLMFAVPLGDIMNRRKLIVVQCCLLALAAMASALAPNFALLSAASLVVGIAASTAQVIVPLAADFAAPEKRGQAIGTVFSGLLAGVLLARTVSGAVGQAFGWRAMYWVAAAISVGLAVWLGTSLPETKTRSRLRYGELLRSMLRLLQEHPELRRACGVQGCLFAGFSAFWAVLALLLDSPQYRMGAAVAGAFGIVGVVGVAVASVAGRVTDRFGSSFGVRVGVSGAALGFLIFAGWESIAGLVVGVIVVDFGVAFAQVSNQSMILGLNEAARNRVNTIYVTAIFLGGSAGSALASAAWEQGGWLAVSLLGFALSVAAIGIHLSGRRRLAAS